MAQDGMVARSPASDAEERQDMEPTAPPPLEMAPPPPGHLDEDAAQEWRRVAAAAVAIGCLLYRPRFVRHRVAAYAARAAVESRSCRTALGGLNPCRSISQVEL